MCLNARTLGLVCGRSRYLPFSQLGVKLRIEVVRARSPYSIYKNVLGNTSAVVAMRNVSYEMREKTAYLLDAHNLLAPLLIYICFFVCV